MKRWEFDKAVLAADMPGVAKLVLFTLAALADWSAGKAAGRIPDEFAPSLTTLAKKAGLSRRSVMTHLNRLEDEGWVKRGRPAVAAAIKDKERTSYALCVPNG